MYTIDVLAPIGSTTIQPWPSKSIGDFASSICLLVKLTAGGPLTYKFQGSISSHDVRDADSDWFDLAVQASTGGLLSAVVSDTRGTAGVSAYFLQRSFAPIRKVRLVVTAASGAVYEASLGVSVTSV